MGQVSTIAIPVIARIRISYTITKRPAKKGLAFDLYFAGRVSSIAAARHNLTKEQSEEAVVAMVAKIHQGASPLTTLSRLLLPLGTSPVYRQTKGVKKRFDLARPKSSDRGESGRPPLPQSAAYLRDVASESRRSTGAPLAALLGHRLRGTGHDQLGGESMTAAYSHGGYGWNQQLKQ
jgi:hypothetical protein